MREDSNSLWQLARSTLTDFALPSLRFFCAGFSPCLSYGAILGYYPFDGNTLDQDNTGNANDLSLAGSPIPTFTVGNGGMFGEALSLGGGNGVAQRTDSDSAAADFDVLFENFSVGFWIKPNSWNDTTLQLVTGKTTGSSQQRGWTIQKSPTADTPNQIQFAFYAATTGSPLYSLTTAFETAPSTSEYMHVAATYRNGGTENPHVASLYINGISAQTVETSAVAVNGLNTADFEVGNRGVQTSTAVATSYLGLIDDYGIASDFASAQQVALTHGLGRLAGVSLGAVNAEATSTQILDVLNAYGAQGSAVAGGQTWKYWSNLNQGTTIGAIGGTLGGGDAFIVLGADGSGISIATPPVLVPGDFNVDGDVDGADFADWQMNFPISSGATLAQGDADGDGDVDGADFVVWQTNFPFTPAPASSPVPEPSACVMALCAVALAAKCYRRS